MFSILPLQLASNIFIAKTPNDLEQFYGVDRMTREPDEIQAAIEKRSYVAPIRKIENCGDIIPLDLQISGDKISIDNLPQDIQRITICKSPDQLSHLSPGELCIISLENENHVAVFKQTTCGDNDADTD